jgi:NitT/TauT family transport system substrate-binding protein
MSKSPFRRSPGLRTASLWLLCAVVLSACGKAPEAPLRIGLIVWPAYEIPFLARSLGKLDPAVVQLVDYRTDDVSQAYRNGLLDVLTVTLDEALRAAESDPDQRIVMVIDFSMGADALLARKGIESLADLKGRRVGAQQDLLSGFFLRRCLEQARLTTADVQLVPTNIPEGEDAFVKGRVDAIVTYEPTRSRLLARGAVELFSTASIPGEVVDVLMVNRRLLKDRPEALEALARGWFEGVDYYRAHPVEAAASMAVRESLTPSEFQKALDVIHIPDLAENRRLLSGPSPALRESLERVQAGLVRMGYLKGRVDLSTLLDDRLVAARAR